MDRPFPPPPGRPTATAADPGSTNDSAATTSLADAFRTPVRPGFARSNVAPFPPPAVAAAPSSSATKPNQDAAPAAAGGIESPPTLAPPTPTPALALSSGGVGIVGGSGSLSSFVHWGSSPLNGLGSSPPTLMQWAAAAAASTPSRRRSADAARRAASEPVNDASDTKGNKRPPPPSPSKHINKRVRAPNVARAFSADPSQPTPSSSSARSHSGGITQALPITSLLSEIENEVAKSDQLVRSNAGPNARMIRGRSVESLIFLPKTAVPLAKAQVPGLSRPQGASLQRIQEMSPARQAATAPLSQSARPPSASALPPLASAPVSRSSSPMSLSDTLPVANELEPSIDMGAFFSDDDDFWADAAASLDKVDIAAPVMQQQPAPTMPAQLLQQFQPQQGQRPQQHPPPATHVLPPPRPPHPAALRDPATRPFPTAQLPIKRYSVIHALMFANEVRVLVVPDPPPPLPSNAKVAPIQPFTFILRDQWRKVELNPGDIVHVVRTPSDPTDPSLLSIQSDPTATCGPNNPWAHHEEHQLGSNSSTVAYQAPIVIDNARNLLIAHPDTLVSGSVVAEAFTCIRRAVLKDRVRSRGISRAQILGTLAHDVVQEMLVSGHAIRAATAASTEAVSQDAPPPRDSRVIADVYQAAVSRRSVDLAAAGVTSDEAKQWVMGVWDRTLKGLVKPAMVQRLPELDVHIESVVDIEENVWAPGVGLKGKLDGTLVASVPRRVAKVIRSLARTDLGFGNLGRVDSGFGYGQGGNERVRGIVPLEIKTGKARPLAHRAQTMLYSLLLLDAYDPFAVLPVGGVLYNAGAAPPAPHKAIDDGPPAPSHPPEGESSAPELVTLNHAEMRDLVITRNQVAAAMRKPTAPLPKVLGPAGASSTCSRCFSVAQCMVIHASVEHGKKELAGIEGAWETMVGHLTPKHVAFLRQWLHLVDLEHEMEESMPVWVRDREQRQQQAPGSSGGNGSGSRTGGLQGGCMCGLEFIRSVDALAMPNDKPKVHSLFRVPANAEGEFEGLPEDPDLTTGDMVIVSREGGPYGLAQGFVHHVDRFGVTVSLDRPFRVDARMAQVARDIFRVDKYELAGLSASTMRANLIDMFIARESHLRDLVVDLHPPRAISTVAKRQFPTMPGTNCDGGDLASLNARQRDVVERCTTNEQDYTLVVGMPGTGKSTTLAHMLRRLVQQGAKVLLSSHTHSAVDTVLIKARELEVPFLRLGAPDRVHASIRDATLAGRTPEMIQRAFSDARVVGVTCLGVSHPLLQPPSVTPSVDKDPSAITVSRPPLFDVCIIDEASQIALPIALGPLALARRFILVGDHHQLSPIVRNPLAAQGGLAVSLFERLLEAHPRSACFLDVQYRMNEEITELVNAATYHGRLTCGSEQVASQRLQLPRPLPSGTPHWIRHALIGPSVVFLNVPSAKETAVAAAKGVHGGLINNLQVDMVKQLSTTMVLAGVSGSDIGVITPYRAQLARIRAALDSAATDEPSFTQAEAASVTQQVGGVECCTIDQYQGRDKTAIIVSLVRCNAQGQTGDLLRDWKRINVAMTRARCKLILIGCAETLRHSMLWATALNTIEGRGWKVTVDPHLP